MAVSLQLHCVFILQHTCQNKISDQPNGIVVMNKDGIPCVVAEEAHYKEVRARLNKLANESEGSSSSANVQNKIPSSTVVTIPVNSECKCCFSIQLQNVRIYS